MADLQHQLQNLHLKLSLNVIPHGFAFLQLYFSFPSVSQSRPFTSSWHWFKFLQLSSSLQSPWILHWEHPGVEWTPCASLQGGRQGAQGGRSFYFHDTMEFSHDSYLGWAPRSLQNKYVALGKSNDAIFREGDHCFLTLAPLGCHLEDQ